MDEKENENKSNQDEGHLGTKPISISDSEPKVSTDAVEHSSGLSEVKGLVQIWCQKLKSAADLVNKRSPAKEPYKHIYKSIEDIKLVRAEVQSYLHKFTSTESEVQVGFLFWIKFTLIHVYSSIAKWSEACDELSQAEDEHKL